MTSWLRRLNIRRNADDVLENFDASNTSSLKRYFRDLSKASATKQIAVGGLTGWCSGFLFCKVGRPAALAIGSSLLVLQIACQQGCITVNWTKLNRTVRKTQQELQQRDGSRILDAVQTFIEENIFLAGGFAGGFLIGLATS